MAPRSCAPVPNENPVSGEPVHEIRRTGGLCRRNAGIAEMYCEGIQTSGPSDEKANRCGITADIRAVFDRVRCLVRTSPPGKLAFPKLLDGSIRAAPAGLLPARCVALQRGSVHSREAGRKVSAETRPHAERSSRPDRHAGVRSSWIEKWSREWFSLFQSTSMSGYMRSQSLKMPLEGILDQRITTGRSFCSGRSRECDGCETRRRRPAREHPIARVRTARRRKPFLRRDATAAKEGPFA